MWCVGYIYTRGVQLIDTISVACRLSSCVSENFPHFCEDPFSFVAVGDEKQCLSVSVDEQILLSLAPGYTVCCASDGVDEPKSSVGMGGCR